MCVCEVSVNGPSQPHKGYTHRIVNIYSVESIVKAKAKETWTAGKNDKRLQDERIERLVH